MVFVAVELEVIDVDPDGVEDPVPDIVTDPDPDLDPEIVLVGVFVDTLDGVPEPVWFDVCVLDTEGVIVIVGEEEEDGVVDAVTVGVVVTVVVAVGVTDGVIDVVTDGVDVADTVADVVEVIEGDAPAERDGDPVAVLLGVLVHVAVTDGDRVTFPVKVVVVVGEGLTVVVKLGV